MKIPTFLIVIQIAVISLFSSCSNNLEVDVSNYQGNALLLLPFSNENIAEVDSLFFFEKQLCFLYIFPDYSSSDFQKIDTKSLELNKRVCIQFYLSPKKIVEILKNKPDSLFIDGIASCSLINNWLYYSKVKLLLNNCILYRIENDGVDYSVAIKKINTTSNNCDTYLMDCDENNMCSTKIEVISPAE